MTIEDLYNEAKERGITDFEIKIGYKDGQKVDLEQIFIYLGEKEIELT